MNSGTRARPRHFVDLTWRWANARPEAIAAKDPSRSLSYRALSIAVERVASALAFRGVRPGDRLLIVAENNVGALTLLLAAQKLGAWPAMVNARLPMLEIEALRALVSPRLMAFPIEGSSVSAAHASQSQATNSLDGPWGPILFGEINELSVAEPVESDAWRQCGLVIFTSGTTGLSKAVMLSQAALVDMGASLATSRQVSAHDQVMGAAPMSHIMGISVLASTLWAGASLELTPRLDFGEMLGKIRDGRMTQMSVVPTVYARLLDYVAQHDIDLSGHRLAYASVGGAPLDPNLKARVEDILKIPLVNAYGMTECAPISRAKPKWDNAPESIGLPELGVAVRIVSPEGADVQDGEIGELWARSPSAMMGYYRNADATAAAMRPGGWIATGDLARRLEDGNLAIVGRAKEMIIRSGFNVYPAEVEAAINAHPEVVQSAVAGNTASDGNEEILAFVQGRREGRLTISDLEGHLRARLAPYKIPGRIYLRDSLPLGHTGKILKRRLLEDLVD